MMWSIDTKRHAINNPLTTKESIEMRIELARITPEVKDES